jgi:hypothetical protein
MKKIKNKYNLDIPHLVYKCKHNHINTQSIVSHLAGKGCRLCKFKISKGEREWLSFNNIPDDKEHRTVKIKFKDKHLAGGYLAINKGTIEEFPIPVLQKKTENKLSELSLKLHREILTDIQRNETEIEITLDSIKSTKKINVITLKAINIKVQGDINMINSTIDNFSTSKFQPNDIIFHKVIDTKSNNVLGYKNNDASNNFNYVLSNNNSGQINFFSLTILDQDLNLIDDIDDYFLHLQFIKMKKQSMEFLLTKLVEYVKDIFLMIGNYLYPSKVNSFMEQQIYLYPDRMFSKYKNPN